MRFFQNENVGVWTSRLIIPLGNLAVASVLFMYAFLGTFSRMLADDYCNSSLLRRNTFLNAVITKYFKWNGRYSNLFFIRLNEYLGKWGIPAMAGIMIAAWVAGLTWLVSELCHVLGIRWHWGVKSLIAGLALFLTLLQSPNLYQALYWRDAVVTYTVPLILLVYTVALIFWNIRHPLPAGRLALMSLLFFVLVFLAGGSSETTSALQIGVFGGLGMAVFAYLSKSRRNDVLGLIAVMLATSLLSMLIMWLAPGNSVRLKTPETNLVALTLKTSIYAAQFIGDSFKTLPLPSLVSIFFPLFLFLVFPSGFDHTLSQNSTTQIWRTTIWIAVSAYILIMLSFAPSAYAQSYPVPHARFPARFVMTLALMAEGVAFGILFQQLQLAPKPASFLKLSAILLTSVLAIFYPVRATVTLYPSLQEYQQRAAAWDARDSRIRALTAQGVQDIVVRGFSGVYDIKELDLRPTNYVNLCAASYYGVKSIIAK